MPGERTYDHRDTDLLILFFYDSHFCFVLLFLIDVIKLKPGPCIKLRYGLCHGHLDYLSVTPDSHSGSTPPTRTVEMENCLKDGTGEQGCL